MRGAVCKLQNTHFAKHFDLFLFFSSFNSNTEMGTRGLEEEEQNSNNSKKNEEKNEESSKIPYCISR